MYVGKGVPDPGSSRQRPEAEWESQEARVQEFQASGAGVMGGGQG